ncbi:MAG: hypothetical protein ACQER4_07140 [Bacteroidota bacterium]
MLRFLFSSKRLTLRSLLAPLLLGFALGLLVLGLASCNMEPGDSVPPENESVSEPWSGEMQWWRGNLHTHTLWSDGDHFPEQVARWYKENGYDFLTFSDHNIFQQGEQWVQPAYNGAIRSAGGDTLVQRYLEEFGESWVDQRMNEDTLEVRLKPIHEYRHLFEEAGEFMMIQGQEITDRNVVHVNAHNTLYFIPPQGGDSTQEIVQNNVDAVHQHHHETGQMVFPHVNHPNFHYAITAEELAAIDGLQFFEVFNGHRGVENYGDENHVDLEEFWDIILTLRLGHLDLDVMYGLAVDDSHHYENSSDATALPGRGWVMVRAPYLTPESIITSMLDGEFYSTSGVELRNFGVEDGAYVVEVEPEAGVDYTIEFIGTDQEHDISSEPVLDEDGEEMRATRSYSEEVGRVYQSTEGTEARYELTGDELYVRARVRSTKEHPNPFQEGDVEVAWTQPIAF